MVSSPITFAVLSIALIVASFVSVSDARPFAAARCIALRRRCRASLARKTDFCSPFTPAVRQPMECYQEACIYCNRNFAVRRRFFPCNRRQLRRRCPQLAPPSATPSNPPSFPPMSPTSSTSPIASMTSTATMTPTPSASASVSMMPSSSIVPSASAPPSPPPSSSIVPPSITPSASASVSASLSMMASPTPSSSAMMSTTSTATATGTGTATATATATPTMSSSPSASASVSAAASSSSVPSMSNTPTSTPSLVPPTTSPTSTSSAEPPSDGSCVWTGRGADIVIPFSQVPEGDGWTRFSRDGRTGLIYERNRPSGRDRAGVKGKLCFNVRAAEAGNYYISAITWAPHRTEHNDFWLSASVNIDLWRRQSRNFVQRAGEWRKAYQNVGPRGFGTDLKTIDRNGHKFVTTPISDGQQFEVCISGRSSRFEVYALILTRCTGRACTGKSIPAGEILAKSASTCENRGIVPTSTPSSMPTIVVDPVPPTPTPTSTSSSEAPENECAWDVNSKGDTISIPLTPDMATDGWTPVENDGLSGLEFEPGKGRGIEKRGEKGVMCFDMRPRESGKYYLTALSYAPHNTEHNDMWVQSSLGFEFWKGQKNGKQKGGASPTDWTKAYQNNGPKGISDDLKTIDRNGHRFLIPNVQAGRIFTVCVSGRSYEFQVFRIVAVKCSGEQCTGGVYEDIRDRPTSSYNCRS